MTSSAASARPGGRGIWPSWTFWRKRVKKRRNRRAQLRALAAENERTILELIRRRLALPAERRTNFLRKRLGPGRTAL
jgi:hypothetical protein